MSEQSALAKYCHKYKIPIEIYSSFKAYCLWMMPDIDGREWLPFHHYIMDRADFYIKQGYGELIVEMPQRHGKELRNSSKIKTSDGWKSIENIQVGDMVDSGCGNLTQVIGVYPQGIKNIYRITFEDDRYTDCGLDHQWQVNCREFRGTNNRVITTQEIMRLLALKTYKQQLYIPKYKPLLNNNISSNLSIPPYVLGALLGDGSFRNGSITFSSADEFIVNKIKSLLKPYNVELSKKLHNKYDYTLRNIRINGLIGSRGRLVTRTKNNQIKDTIFHLGLFNKLSHEKFIPELYLNLSFEQRIELIQGLMDTDGGIALNSGIEFTSTSKQLALDLQYLIRSIGGQCKLAERITYFTYKGIKKLGRISYRCLIRIDDQKLLFSLPRKSERAKQFHACTNALQGLRIKKVEYIDQDLATCIAVKDSPFLYTTNDFVVTHNTQIMGKLLTSYFLGMNPDKAVLYATNTSGRAKEFTKEDLYSIIFSEKYKRAFPRVKLKYELDNAKNTQETKEQRKGSTLLEDRFDILNRKGQFNARGVDQAINGIRAHLLICDDPYANYADAQSEIIRKKTTAWYDGDATGRTEAKTIIINISTRYHDEDIIGHVLETAKRIKEMHLDYHMPEVITFRAEAEIDNEFPYDNRKRGEFLIPEFRDKYLKIKYADPVIWSCVYQQTPMNTAGLFLKSEHLIEYLHTVDYSNIYISVDTNMRASAIDGDKAGITVWQYTHPHKYLVTLLNQQYTLPELLNAVLKLAHDYPNYTAILVETRASGDGLCDFLELQLPRVIRIDPCANKAERFQWCLPEFHAGNVWLPPAYKCPDVILYRRQLLGFTGGKKEKNDLADSTSQFLNYLRQNVIIRPNGTKNLVSVIDKTDPQVRRVLPAPGNYKFRSYGRKARHG